MIGRAFLFLAAVLTVVVLIVAEALTQHAAASPGAVFPARTAYASTAANRSLVRPSLPPSASAGPTTSPSADASPDALRLRSVAARSPDTSSAGKPAVSGPSVGSSAPTSNEPTVAQWATLRRCESGDDYDQRANPRYRGAYQVGFGEWAEYGGTGRDPADASPAEQDAVALRLWQARGWQPWASSSACSGLR